MIAAVPRKSQTPAAPSSLKASQQSDEVTEASNTTTQLLTVAKPSDNDMSSTMTIDPNNPPNRSHQQIGMENGYAMSPMYALYLEYAQEDKDRHSVSRRAAWLAASLNLDLEDVQESGGNGNSAEEQKYRITSNLLSRIQQTINKFQVFLERMAGLIPERRKGQFFVIDPGDMIIRTLTKSQSKCSSRLDG